MSTEVFFNKPGRPIPLDRLRDDILSATQSVSVACAWFTLGEIADSIIASKAATRTVILNAVDLSRNSGAGHKVAQRLQRSFDNSGLHWSRFNIVKLGGDDYHEGIMHHKFVVLDSRIVWTGSYNLTFQAKKNYETLLRIDDPEIGEIFEDEADTLAMCEQVLWTGTAEDAWVGTAENDAFRCCQCNQILPSEQMVWGFPISQTLHSCLNCNALAGTSQ